MIFSFIVLSLAAYRLTRLVIKDTIVESLRQLVLRRLPIESRVTELLACFWCTGFWAAILVYVAWRLQPSLTMVMCVPLAISSLVGLMSMLDKENDEA
jgi:hypothetical protein